MRGRRSRASTSWRSTSTDLVNEVHRQGFGLNGEKGADFFVERPFVTNVFGQLRLQGNGSLRFDVGIPHDGHQQAPGQGRNRPGRDPHPARPAGKTSR